MVVRSARMSLFDRVKFSKCDLEIALVAVYSVDPKVTKQDRLIIVWKLEFLHVHLAANYVDFKSNLKRRQ
jgi:hypothetical protein